MQKDFITATPDTGGGSGSVNVTAAANTGAARSTTLNVSGSGITKTITISQEKKPSVDVSFQAIVTCNMRNSGTFDFAIGVGNTSGSDTTQSPKVTVPYPVQQGVPYSTVQLTYEAAENIIRMQIVFFGIKMNNGLNYLDFRVFGLKNDPQWPAKEIGRVLPQTQAILKYLTPQDYTNEDDYYSSLYICPEGVMDAPETMVFILEINPEDFIPGAIPGTPTNTGVVVDALFSMNF